MSDEKVQKLKRINNTDDLADANLDLVEDIYNDHKLSPQEKMKSFSQGVRNQNSLSANRRETLKMMHRFGLKVEEGELKKLSQKS